MFHMVTSKQMFVNALLQIFFLLLLLNRPFDILDFVENRLHKIFWGSQSTAPLENTRFSPFLILLFYDHPADVLASFFCLMQKIIDRSSFPIYNVNKQ